ncbi:MAG: hypothetical protein QOG76_6932 [Pseudonocardiales bacterium]|nr:hypothetical protein [Pseudonocardiales bacterium]
MIWMPPPSPSGCGTFSGALPQMAGRLPLQLFEPLQPVPRRRVARCRVPHCRVLRCRVPRCRPRARGRRRTRVQDRARAGLPGNRQRRRGVLCTPGLVRPASDRRAHRASEPEALAHSAQHLHSTLPRPGAVHQHRLSQMHHIPQRAQGDRVTSLAHSKVFNSRVAREFGHGPHIAAPPESTSTGASQVDYLRKRGERPPLTPEWAGHESGSPRGRWLSTTSRARRVARPGRRVTRSVRCRSGR